MSEKQHASDLPESLVGIRRRDLLAGGATLGLLATAGAAVAGDGPGHRHEDHAPKHGSVLEAVNHCIVESQQCMAHCLVAFQEGDLSLADCARKVNEMRPICEAFSYQLAANSPYVPALAAVCRQACEDCEVECRKHEDKHIECKDCAEACKQVIAAIDAMKA